MMNEASSSSSRRESVVVDAGRRQSSCGYCKSGRRSSVSHGLWADRLTVQDYQGLLDRGWRRSGSFLYKPEMETTCCPSYTIRLRADDFLPTKEQSRVLKRMDRYLDGALDVQKQNKSVSIPSTSSACNSGGSPRCSEATSPVSKNEKKIEEEQFMNYMSKQLDEAVQSCIGAGDLPRDIQFPSGMIKKVPETKRRQLMDGSKDLLYTSNISFQIAAALRRATSAQNDFQGQGSSKCQANETGSPYDRSPKLIAEVIASALQNLVGTPSLTVKACNGHINFFSAIKTEACVKQEDSSHPCIKPSNPRQGKKENKGVEETLSKKRKLEIRLNRSSFDPVEFALYKKYQVAVHNDKPNQVSESSYKRFLVETPLIYVPPTSDNTVPPCGFGSFHQQYVVDGKLIAVGVVDILPNCLSSKYLFWDPDYACLSLGKLSALKEIDWVQKTRHHCPSLEFYYLGYYIHSCSKMRYKAAYRPSELLCPQRYEWVPYSLAKPLLDRKKYAVLSDSLNPQNQDSSLPELEVLAQEEHHEDSNEIHVDRDTKMHDSDSESSDDESLNETNSSLAGMEDHDLGSMLIKLDGHNLKYRELERFLDPAQRAYLERRLRGYLKVVGPQLSERMLYSVS